MIPMRVWPSGVLIDPLSPDPALVSIHDIAYHLAGINRYGGASRLTVAQHCCEMALFASGLSRWGFTEGEQTTQFAFECLMHDAPEYLLGDMIRPLKHLPGFGADYREAEVRVSAVLQTKYGYGLPKFAVMVDKLDKRMCRTEQRDLFGTEKYDAIRSITIRPWTAETAEREFMRLFEKFKPRPARIAERGLVAA